MTKLYLRTLEPGHQQIRLGYVLAIEGSYMLWCPTLLRWLYTELNPNIPQNEEGFKHCVRSSHSQEESFHAALRNSRIYPRRGRTWLALFLTQLELFDNPDVIAATVTGDGEGETGPLISWLVVKYLLEPSQRWGDPSNLHSNVEDHNQPSSNAKQTKNWPLSLKVLVENHLRTSPYSEDHEAARFA